jgi:hypothetical protein
MNYATQVGKPTAHITKKKSRLKVYNGHIVFLNDKDNFEFEIHNPKQKSVLCKIKLNGEYISTSGVVLKPGQRVFLERFLDTNNKFEFSTYEVKDTSENRSAIDLNGDVLIEFYNEQEVEIYPHLSGGNWSTGWTNINTGPHIGSGQNPNNPFFTTTASNSNMSYFSNTASSIGGVRRMSKSSNVGPQIKSLKSKKSIETGRVEKGEKSNQSFTNSYTQFNYFVSDIVKFKIQPAGTKNVNAEEIRQYCTECGTKMKKNYKFCPSCGNEL